MYISIVCRGTIVLFLISEDYRRLLISNNRIYITDSNITAIHSEYITQSFPSTEYKALDIGKGTLEYRFINALNLDNNCIILVVDIPETYVNICKMCSSSITSIEIPYIEVKWIKQSVDIEALVTDVPKHLDVLDYEGRIMLEYYNCDDKFYSELIRHVGLYNKLYMESHDEEDNPDILGLIEIHDNLCNLIKANKNEKNAELIYRLQCISDDIFLDEDIYIEELFPAIFAEYYWNEYFKSNDYSVIGKIKAGDMQWVEE